MLDHMNADHRDTLRDLCRHYHGTTEPEPELIALDPEGFRVRGATRVYYFAYAAACVTVDSIRAEIVRMTLVARAA